MRTLALALLLSGGLTASGAPDPDPSPKPSETYNVECSLSNPAYSGYCTVTENVPRRLSPPAACQRVLSCLNNSQCTKTYCNATTVRGGWKLESAKRQPPR